MMPGMNGLEFCRWLRARPQLAGLKFVLLTGMDDEQTRAEALDAGADVVITKPFDRTDLIHRLAQLRARCLIRWPPPLAGPAASVCWLGLQLTVRLAPSIQPTQGRIGLMLVWRQIGSIRQTGACVDNSGLSAGPLAR